MENLLENLNEEQSKAVLATEGPVLIIAGAGSGKTRVLTSRVAYLIGEKGVEPDRILALTFTKKAAGEMKERIASFVGDRKARRIWMGTFHSVFIRFLREFADLIGYPAAFTIYDTTDSVSAVKACIRDLKLDEKVYKPREVFARISRVKNNLITAENYAGPAGEKYREADRLAKRGELWRIFLRYAEHCKTSGVMDFDDILLNTNILLKYHEDALKAIASRFSYILVDEYQDTNLAQYYILKKLAVHGNLCVVGDDSQSIYAFRGAEIQNILRFQAEFPGTRVFHLVNNYRSTRVIVGASNSVIAHNEGRMPKECRAIGDPGEKIRIIRGYTAEDEAISIADAILDRLHMDGASYSDFAVLYRTNSQSRALEEALRKRNLPYIIYSGNSFFERAEVRDVMAFLRLAVNPSDDEAFRRAIGKPPRGIGDTSVAALGAAAEANSIPLFEAAYLSGLEAFGLKPAAAAKIRAFCEMIRSAAGDVMHDSAYAVATRLADASGIYLYYKSDTSIEGMARTANVEELMSSIATYVEERTAELRADYFAESDLEDESEVPDSALPPVTLGDYLENVSLLSAVDNNDEDGANKVVLMTAHSSKGLEFPYVFISGLEENLFPSGGFLLPEKDLEEERRLFYVALTRAKKVVVLTYATSRMRNGKRENNPPSRFLGEIDPEYISNPALARTRAGFFGTSPDSFGGSFGSSRSASGGSRSSSGYSPDFTSERSTWRTSSAPTRFTPGSGYPGGGGYSSDSRYPSSRPSRPSDPRPSRPGSTSGSGGPSRFSSTSGSSGMSRPGSTSGSGYSSRPGDPQSSARPDPLEAVRNRPLPPKVSDENFVPDTMDKFFPGARIEHNRFGAGTVLDITGTIPDLKARVNFDAYGEKTLLLKYAKMRLL